VPPVLERYRPAAQYQQLVGDALDEPIFEYRPAGQSSLHGSDGENESSAKQVCARAASATMQLALAHQVSSPFVSQYSPVPQWSAELQPQPVRHVQ
jgi:hypothetical protein